MTYLVFIAKPSGYELHEREGDPPGPGATIEQDGKAMRVAKVARAAAGRQASMHLSQRLANASAATSPSTSACARPFA
jgi:hypothetical protein